MKYKKSSDGVISHKKDYSKNLLLSLEELKNYPGHVVQTVTIPAHTKQRNHKHHKQTEIAYVLQGSARYYVNGMKHEMHPGDTIVDEPEEPHYIQNDSDEEFTVLVFKINMPEGTDDSTWLEE